MSVTVFVQSLNNGGTLNWHSNCEGEITLYESSHIHAVTN